MLKNTITSSLVAAAALAAGTAHGHQVRGHVSQAGLDFISAQVPALVPKDLYLDPISKDVSCMTATQRDTHVALEVHDFSITIPQEGRLRLYLAISAAGDGELFVDDPYACFGEMTCQDELYVNDARATIDFDVMLADGKPTAVFHSVDLELSEDDIDIEFSGCAADDIANWMIDFAKEYVTDMLLRKAEEMAREALGPKVEEMLAGVGAFEGHVGSTDFSAALTGIMVRGGGVDLAAEIGLTSKFEPAECVRDFDPGPPQDVAGEPPDLSQAQSHVGLAINLGLVNGALYQIWRRGLTCVTDDVLEALGVHIPTDHLLQLIPGFPPGTTLDMEMRFTAPPRVVASSGGDDVDSLGIVAVIEGAEAKLIGHRPDGTDKVIELGLDIQATMALGVDPATNAMVATPIGMEIERMYIDQVWAAETGLDSARLVQVIHEQAMPKLIEKMGVMPVTGPVFATGEYAVILRDIGNDDAFLTLNADLFHIPANDTGAPETSIIEYPAGPVSVASSIVRVSGVDGMIPTELLRYQVSVDGVERALSYIRAFKVGTAGESGTYEVQVSAVDLGGNTDGSPATVEVTVDGVAPVVYLEGERIRAMDGGSTELRWTATDDMTGSTLLGARIELYQVKDESDLFSREHVETIELGPGATSATVEVADGAMYQAEVHVTDAVGNESIAAVLLDSKNGCGCAAGGGSTGLTTLLASLAVLLVLRRRRR